MRFLATLATTLVTMGFAAFALQPALAQEKKATEETAMVAGRPTLPTTSVEDLFKMREQWGTEPSIRSAEAKPEKTEGKK